MSDPFADEYQALQQRLAEALARQHQLCAEKDAIEAELRSLLKAGPADSDPEDHAGLCDGKLRQCQHLAADAEELAAEIGRCSGDLLMLQLHHGTRPAKQKEPH